IVDGRSAARRKRSGSGAGAVRLAARAAGYVHVRLCGSLSLAECFSGNRRAFLAEAVYSPIARDGSTGGDPATNALPEYRLIVFGHFPVSSTITVSDGSSFSGRRNTMPSFP